MFSSFHIENCDVPRVCAGKGIVPYVKMQLLTNFQDILWELIVHNYKYFKTYYLGKFLDHHARVNRIRDIQSHSTIVQKQ